MGGWEGRKEGREGCVCVEGTGDVPNAGLRPEPSTVFRDYVGDHRASLWRNGPWLEGEQSA